MVFKSLIYIPPSIHRWVGGGEDAPRRSTLAVPAGDGRSVRVGVSTFSANRQMENIRLLVEKYRGDVDMMKIADKELDREMTSREDEIKRCQTVLCEKDDQIAQTLSTMEELAKQIMAMRVNDEQQRRVVGPLKDSLERTKTNVKDVSDQGYRLPVGGGVREPEPACRVPAPVTRNPPPFLCTKRCFFVKLISYTKSPIVLQVFENR